MLKLNFGHILNVGHIYAPQRFCDLLIISLYQLEGVCGWVESVANALLEFGSWPTSRMAVDSEATPFRYCLIYFE